MPNICAGSLLSTQDGSLSPLYSPLLPGTLANMDSMLPYSRERPSGAESLRHAHHLWLARPELVTDPAVLERCRALLSDDERMRMAAYRFDKHRLLYLVAHALVRLVLSRYAPVSPADWRFSEGPHGKPAILLPPSGALLSFNLSHCAGLVACLVTARRDCGVDVEYMDVKRDIDGIARRMFSTHELQVLDSQQDDARVRMFYTFWTLREAYGKGIGSGLAGIGSTTGFEIRRDGSVACDQGSSNSDSGRWSFHSMQPTRSHLLAAAIRDGGGGQMPLHRYWMDFGTE